MSRRETEILREIATGKTNKNIAYELGIRETTVKQFVTLINKKLNVQNRTQAALLARITGWSDPHYIQASLPSPA